MNYLSNKTITMNSSQNGISFIVTTSFLIILTIIIATFVITPPTFASELDEFEKAATIDNCDSKSAAEKKKEEEKKESQENDHVDFFWDIFKGTMDLVFSILDDQAKLSFARIDGGIDTAPIKVDTRQIGEPTLPFFQMDYKYFYINPEIVALDGCLEFGYGGLGFEYRNTYFIEAYPADSLTLNECHLLVRLSRTSSQEYGIGIGTINLNGNEDNSGFSLTFPIKLYPNESLGVKFKPTLNWIHGNFIRDNDLSLVLSQRFGTLELGYRFLEVNGADLSGAYVGLALHY